MSTIQGRFDIRGMDCFIETTDGVVSDSRAHLYVEIDGRVITDASGYCSPIYNYCHGLDGWRLRTTYGAARNSMIRRILRDAVGAEIDAHAEFCMQQIEDGEIDPETGADIP